MTHFINNHFSPMVRSWANLRSLQRLVAKEEMVLDVNVRERQVNGMKTLQLETLGASAIQCFDKVMLLFISILVRLLIYNKLYRSCCPPRFRLPIGSRKRALRDDVLVVAETRH